MFPEIWLTQRFSRITQFIFRIMQNMICSTIWFKRLAKTSASSKNTVSKSHNVVLDFSHSTICNTLHYFVSRYNEQQKEGL
jgi:hypothetical protein